MSESPDFYLASSEGYNLSEPRKCWCVKRVAIGTKADLCLVKVSPPIIYHNMSELDFVVFGSRLYGYSIFAIQEWPFYVLVARVIRPFSTDDPIGINDLETIAWAELYSTELAATMAMKEDSR